MNETFKKFLGQLVNEWSYRCDKGYPDPTNEQDLSVLESVLEDFETPREVREEVIETVRAEAKKDNS
jgi:hypothetical protein